MIHAELTAAIAAWVNKPEIEPSIPTFIALAQAQIARRLSQAGVSGAVQRATATISSEYSAAPADLARLVSGRLSSGEPVQNVTAESLEAMFAACPQARGAPTHMTLAGRELRVFPAPAAPRTVELVYQARPAPLSGDEGGNWALAEHPDVFLYGALVQSAPFLGEDQRIATWSALYGAALEAMIEAEAAKRGSQATPGFRANMPHRCAHG